MENVGRSWVDGFPSSMIPQHVMVVGVVCFIIATDGMESVWFLAVLV